jgi:hypothetical protein
MLHFTCIFVVGLCSEVVVSDLTESSAVDVASHFQNTDALFITLGVGAPSKLPRSDEGKHELLRVDCLVPTAYAAVAKSNGVPLVSILTAAGPDITADYGFIMGNAAGGGWYRHVKGQVEQNLIDLKVSNLAIFRPAAIVGNRYLGDFGSWLMPKFDWMLPLKYNSIKQEDLAAAMVNHALNQPASAATRQEPIQPNVLVAEGESLFALVPPSSF